MCCSSFPSFLKIRLKYLEIAQVYEKKSLRIHGSFLCATCSVELFFQLRMRWLVQPFCSFSSFRPFQGSRSCLNIALSIKKNCTHSRSFFHVCPKSLVVGLYESWWLVPLYLLFLQFSFLSLKIRIKLPKSSTEY